MLLSDVIGVINRKQGARVMTLAAMLAERVRTRAQSLQMLRFEAAWPGITEEERATLRRAIAILERYQSHDQALVEKAGVTPHDDASEQAALSDAART